MGIAGGVDNMKIGWYCGKDDWAFKHLTEHLVSEMDDMHHENNKTGDVQIFMHVGQMSKKSKDELSKSIIHLDGNRWWSGE